jgi:hypothetical protein
MEARTTSAPNDAVTALQLHILLWQRELIRRLPR